MFHKFYLDLHLQCMFRKEKKKNKAVLTYEIEIKWWLKTDLLLAFGTLILSLKITMFSQLWKAQYHLFQSYISAGIFIPISGTMIINDFE